MRLHVVVGGLVCLAAGIAAPDSGAAQPGPARLALPSTYDIRVQGGPGSAVQATAAQRRLRRALGASGVVTRDPLNGGLRLVARRAGFLTAPGEAPPAHVALGYVRPHAAAFGLEAADLETLVMTRQYRSESGMTHLQWAQTYRGIPAFDHGLRANVTADGRLINIGGSPRPDLKVPSTEPRLGAVEAVRAAVGSIDARPVGPARGPQLLTLFDGGHRASLVLFGDRERVRLAWRMLLFTSDKEIFDAIVDATSGELLFRRSLVHDVAALVFENYPGAPSGGQQVPTEFPAAWISGNARLFGTYAHVHSDPEDSYFTGPSGPTPALADEIPPTGGAWNYDQDARPADPPQICPPIGCSWENGDPGFSWTVNRNQAGTQLFYFVNRFHDHLRDAPGIGFDAASGNFEGADRVLAQVDDGATTGAGNDFPNCGHTNNASMSVLPDGFPALMEMFLWSGACGDPATHDVNGADDAFIVYHEYTHGLSSRLVTDTSGFGALDGRQSGAMGEAWSDWYALDFLAARGFEVDTTVAGELLAGRYENTKIREQAFDCPVGVVNSACPDGGYTYGDFAKILGFPEIHADGEIWVETLWDLRRALIAKHGAATGVDRTRALVTDGMRLSLPNPTFLEMRDFILQADVARGFGERDLIWAVFAARGMGVRASTTGDFDTSPVEDFSVPPPLPPPASTPSSSPPPPGDTTAPTVSDVSMTRTRFRVGLDRTPRSAQRAPVGSAFRFRLDEMATVNIALARARPGRRVGRSCRRPTRRLRDRPRCTRYLLVGTLTRRNRQVGRNRVAFSGRIGVTALRPGRHRATVSAIDGARNRSRPSRTSFTIVLR